MVDWLVAFVEPIALVGWALAFAGVVVYRAGGKSLVLRAIVPAAAVYMFVTTPLGANALLLPLEHAARDSAAACKATGALPDIMVVLAGGASGAADSPDDYGRLTLASLRRAIAAARLSARTQPQLLIISGGSPKRTVSESSLMAHFLRDIGAPVENLLIEEKSENTVENAREVARMANKRGVQRITLITTASHMPRARYAFSIAGLEACAYPMDYAYVPVRLPQQLMPRMSSLNKTATAMHEYLGLLAMVVQQVVS